MPNDLLNRMDKAWKRADDFISSKEALYGREAITMQKDLWENIQSEIYMKMERTASGAIASSPKNIKLIGELDDLWLDFQENTMHPTFIKLSGDLLKTADLSTEYFKIFPNANANTQKAINGMRRLIEGQLGIGADPKGNLYFTPGGYLDKLVEGTELQNRISKVLSSQIASGGSFQEMMDEMRTVIEGSDQVNGAMMRYFKTYVYDAFSGVQASADNYLAEISGYQHFVYSGTLIETTRPFCEERANKIFHKDVIKDWEEMNWAGKNREVPFVVARGGYNCRHRLLWIPEGAVDTIASTKEQTPGEVKDKAKDPKGGAVTKRKDPKKPPPTDPNTGRWKKKKFRPAKDKAEAMKRIQGFTTGDAFNDKALEEYYSDFYGKFYDEARRAKYIKQGIAKVKRQVYYGNLISKSIPLEQMNEILEGLENTLGRFGCTVSAVGHKIKPGSWGTYWRGNNARAEFLKKPAKMRMNPAPNEEGRIRWQWDSVTVGQKLCKESAEIARDASSRDSWTGFTMKKKIKAQEENLELLEKNLAQMQKDLKIAQESLKPGLQTAIRDLQQNIRLQNRILLEYKATWRWSTATGSPDGRLIYAVTVHESYHAIYYQMDLEGVWLKQLRDLAVTKDLKLKVSTYGAKEGKPEELFAEAMTMFDSGEDIPEPIYQAIINTFKSVGIDLTQ